MASVISDPNGRKRIQFTAGDGSRKTIRFGKATQRQAESVKVRIEQLVLNVSGISNGTIDDETARWLTGLDDTMYGKLAAVGLVERRESINLRTSRESMTLRAFLDGYIQERHDVKGSTVIIYKRVAGNLTAFFGDNKPLQDITLGEADQWRLYLVGLDLAENTIRRRSGVAKQFFYVATKRKLISGNPFEDLKAAIVSNPQRYYFLKPVEAQKILDTCPNAEWRLIFALCRYGGLRCPSEIMALRWGDINWEHSRMTIRSPKTEHHMGHESRLIPIFPELLPHLQEVYDEAKEGTEYVIDRYRKASLRKNLMQFISKAGLKPWPKLFQNLRSTRETELMDKWPEHVVCSWIGNSRAVARKHYLQVTDEHFEQAAMSPEQAAQNATQQPHINSPKEQQPIQQTPVELAELNTQRNLAATCSNPMGDTGLGPVASCV